MQLGGFYLNSTWIEAKKSVLKNSNILSPSVLTLSLYFPLAKKLAEIFCKKFKPLSNKIIPGNIFFDLEISRYVHRNRAASHFCA